MARPKQSESGLGLDRRQLLASVAVATTAGLAPIAEYAGPAYPAETASEATIPASDVPARNVCAGTARKIEEIAARNIIRAEAAITAFIDSTRTAPDENGRRCDGVRGVRCCP